MKKLKTGGHEGAKKNKAGAEDHCLTCCIIILAGCTALQTHI